MNQENLQYLKDNLKYLGFGEKLYPRLEEEMQRGGPQFQLPIENEMQGKAFAAILSFRKSDNTDRYFLNSYHASLQRKDGETTDQAFYINKGKGVTAKEAYNLLDGRAVHKELTNKEGKPYQAWIQLDFEKKDKHNNHEVKQYHEAYGFDLKEALSKFDFSEMKDPEKEKALLQSLEKGNLQAVTVEKEGSISKMFVEAAPQYKSVNLYDGQMKRVQKEDLQQYQAIGNLPTSGQKQENIKEVKQAVTSKKSGSLKSKTPSGLLPQKRNAAKKGQHLK